MLQVQPLKTNNNKKTPSFSYLCHVSINWPALIILCLYSFCAKNQLQLSHFYSPPPPSPTPFSWGFSNRAPKNSSLMKVEEAWSKLLRACGVLLLQARSQLQNPEERRDIPTLVTFCTTGSKSREDKEMSRGFYGSTMPVTEQESWMSWSCRPTQLVNHQWD